MSETARTPPVHAIGPVAWDGDGMPFSPRFGERYRSAGIERQGGWAQARHVFLAGCALTTTDGQCLAHPAWRDAKEWRVLENGFGLGLNFLATWHAWRQDPQRPARLLYEGTEAWPPSIGDVRRSAAPFDELAPLADALAGTWTRLLQGDECHFDQGRVTVRLHGSDALAALRRVPPGVDSVFLDGFNPKLNPDMWSGALLEVIGTLARPGAHAATWCVLRTVRDGLKAAGFTVRRREGLPPKWHCLTAVKQPASDLPA